MAVERKLRVRVEHVSRFFGATRALHDFSFEFIGGRTYALVGENGSGKSTLVKILSGVLSADRGSVAVEDKQVRRPSPRRAIAAGVATCFQEVLVEDNLSVLRNIFLWDRGWVRPCTPRSRRIASAELVLRELSDNPPELGDSVEGLSLASKQLVVIARAMVQPNASVLVLDEPTAALDQGDSSRVLDAIARRASEGVVSIFTSHRLEEIERLGDEIVVLRNGEIVGALQRGEFTADQLLRLMSGGVGIPGMKRQSRRGSSNSPDASRELAEVGPVLSAPHGELAVRTRRGIGDAQSTAEDLLVPGPRQREEPGSPQVVDEDRTIGEAAPARDALRVRSVVLGVGTQPCEFSVRWGEITGLAGLDGHGQERLLRYMGGIERPAQGHIEAADLDGTFARVVSHRRAVRLGVVYVPRDRKTQGILPTLCVLDNFALPTVARRSRLGFVGEKQALGEYRSFAERLSITAASWRSGIISLSGGNQQKVVIARWLAARPRIVLLDDPTRGVDVSTKLDIYRLLRGLADDGRAVVIVSTELTEIASLCDRVIVLYRMEVATDLQGTVGGDIPRDAILRGMFGQVRQP